MPFSIKQAFIALPLLLALASCASDQPKIVAPDTQPGDQILNEYLVNDWCTNREETATANQEAGHSGLLNVRPIYWRLSNEGEWEISDSGFIFTPHGSWKLMGKNQLQLVPEGQSPITYDARFEDANLYLTDTENQFLVLKSCE